MAEQKKEHIYTTVAKTSKEVDFQVQTSKGKAEAKPRKFFFAGPSGGGKTTLAGYFPDPFFLDSEEGVDSIPHPVQFVKVSNWKALFDLFTQIEKIPFKTFVWNDLTTTAMVLQREVAKAAGRNVPELQDRGVAAEHLRTLIYQLFQKEFSDKNIILITQTSVKQDELLGITSNQPVLPGQLGAEIPPFCDEVWRFFGTSSPQKPTSHFVQAQPDGMWPWLKSRTGLPNQTDVTGPEKIREFLKKGGIL